VSDTFFDQCRTPKRCLTPMVSDTGSSQRAAVKKPRVSTARCPTPIKTQEVSDTDGVRHLNELSRCF